MFVQIIKGTTKDAAGVRRQGERWNTDVRPGAIGFLGSTVGVSDDGTFYAFARFADAASARANSERPEQSAWWSETAKLFDGGAHVPRDERHHGAARRRLRYVPGSCRSWKAPSPTAPRPRRWRTTRCSHNSARRGPTCIGSVRMWFAGGAFVEAAYFTSEDAARAG